MVDLYFDDDADARLTSLEADPGRRHLLSRVNLALDDLVADSGQVHLRRRRFQNGLWCIVVAADDEHWAILWEPHPEIADAVVIQYLGPATFA